MLSLIDGGFNYNGVDYKCENILKVKDSDSELRIIFKHCESDDDIKNGLTCNCAHKEIVINRNRDDLLSHIKKNTPAFMYSKNEGFCSFGLDLD